MRIGFEGAAVPQLTERFPNLLGCQVERHVQQVLVHLDFLAQRRAQQLLRSRGQLLVEILLQRHGVFGRELARFGGTPQQRFHRIPVIDQVFGSDHGYAGIVRQLLQIKAVVLVRVKANHLCALEGAKGPAPTFVAGGLVISCQSSFGQHVERDEATIFLELF